MNQAESLIGREVCSSPEELAGLFDQWKSSPEGQFAEREIAYAVYRLPTLSFDLIEPLRDFTFGFYLSQEVFSFSKKYPYPALKIDQTGKVITAGVSSRYIFAGEAWLQKHSSANHPSTYLITTAVEEFSHWVLKQAVKHRSEAYRTSLDSRYRLTQKNLKRGLEETSLAKFERISAKSEEASAIIKEIEILTPLKYFYLNLLGKISQRIEDARKLNTEAGKRLAEAEKWHDFNLTAFLEHSSTLEEYMGTVWRNQVSQRYYPCSEEARDAKKQLEKILTYKRQKAVGRRQTESDLLR